MKGGFRLLVLNINKDEPPDLISSLLFWRGSGPGCQDTIFNFVKIIGRMRIIVYLTVRKKKTFTLP